MCLFKKTQIVFEGLVQFIGIYLFLGDIKLKGVVAKPAIIT